MENRRGARPSTEYTGRSLEEALRRASEALGVPAGNINYTVVRDSTRSILGFVRTGEVTVRVSAGARADEEGADDDAASEQAADEEVEDDDVDEMDGERQPQVAPVAAEVDEDDEDEEPQPGNLRESAQPSRGSEARLEDVASDVVSTLLDKMGALAAVEVVDRGGKLDRDSGEVSPLTLNIVGDDLGGLIGRRGETLRNLQFIVRLIVSRRMGEWPNLILDVENYKAKRMVTLRTLARRMADQVRQTHQMVVLEPMPAHERRIVHLSLRDDPDVYTESTGEDEARQVQIIPR
jgi:spoIIIJ-associated protein